MSTIKNRLSKLEQQSTQPQKPYREMSEQELIAILNQGQPVKKTSWTDAELLAIIKAE